MLCPVRCTGGSCSAWLSRPRYALRRSDRLIRCRKSEGPDKLWRVPGLLGCGAHGERFRDVKIILESFGHHEGHVFNLGHGIHPTIPPEHAEAFVNAVHEFSPKYHQQ